MTATVELAGVAYRYPGADRPALANFDLTVAAGERLLVAGPSGSGKSTLLRCLDGLVPHFYGGTLAGRVRAAGRDPVAAAPRGMSDAVGLVFQDPEKQFVTARVEDELAFAMENHDLPRAVMGERIAAVLDRLGIAHLRHRAVDTLSGGERQRVAIASVLTLRPAILALDEPTSQLDPPAAAEVLALLAELNRDLGLTVILSEHRLERVAGWADRVCHLPGLGRAPVVGPPRELLAAGELAPPLARLAAAVGLRPPPLVASDAGELAARLRARLSVAAAGGGRTPGPPRPAARTGPAVIEARGVTLRHGAIEALREVDFAVAPGERVVLAGLNGAGKSTLLKLLVGLLRPDRGEVRVLGRPTAGRRLAEIALDVGLVPQNPARLLFADTVADEVRFTRRAHGLPADDPAPLLARLGLAAHAGTYPHDLSGGERQRAALAAIFAADPQVLLLDEPTRGLDHAAKEALATLLIELAAAGTAVVVATHDVELAARFGERMVILESGRLIEDAPLGEAMLRHPPFATEVVRLLGDPTLTTVEDVLERLGTTPQ